MLDDSEESAKEELNLPIPNLRFLGLKFYGVTLIVFAIMMVYAVLACRIEDYREKKKA